MDSAKLQELNNRIDSLTATLEANTVKPKCECTQFFGKETK